MRFSFKFIILLVFYNCLFFSLKAQIPTNCFEIESILVDACVPGTGCNNSASPTCSCEGKNEMVRLKIGPSQLNANDLTATWPNTANTFRGICQDAGTAAIVAALNSTIQSCGRLIEPTNGILPAGSNVLLITSTDFCTAAHSFINLSDSIYVIFQCSGNFNGHFANYGTGTRTATISFGSGCADQVTYDRALLVNENGNQTAADGATVNFTWSGNTSYVNNGCQAPFIPLTASATSNATSSLCPGDAVALFGISTGNIISKNWSGGNGTFINSNQDSALYIISSNDTGLINIIYSVRNFCNDIAQDTVTINVQSGNNATFSITPNDTVCTGESVTLTVSGGNNFLWNTTATTNEITVTTSGNYSVTVTGNCGTQIFNQAIIVLPNPTVTIGNNVTICPGDEIELTATGATKYLWSTGNTTSSISVSPAVSTNYSVTATDNDYCFASDTISVTVTNALQAQITGNNIVCIGDTATLTASGGSVYNWSTGETNASISVSPTENTTYSVTVSSGSTCVDSTTVLVTVNQLPVVNAGNDSSICEGTSITLTATGGVQYIWSNGGDQNTTNVQPLTTTTYTVTATDNNGCSNTSSVTISVQQNPVDLNISTTGETCPDSNNGNIVISNGNNNIQYSIDNVSFINDSIFENLSPGNYTVYIKDENCLFTESIDISEADPVSLNVDSIVELKKGSTVTVNINLTSAGYSVSITPSTGLSCDDCLTPNISDLEENTTYTITATNGNCTYTDSFTVIVIKKEFIIFPSAFTPNNDNLNDIFRPSFSGIINDYSLKIYNRWGEQLFQSNSISLGWDGTYKGEMQPLETYTWYCTYKDFRNEEKLIKGNLTLIR